MWKRNVLLEEALRTFHKDHGRHDDPVLLESAATTGSFVQVKRSRETNRFVLELL